MNAALLLIAGSDADARAAGSREGISASGNTDIFQLIDRRLPYHRMHVTRQFFRHGRQPDLLPYRCLLNLITDADENPKVLDVLRRILRSYPGKVINRPEAVLRSSRDEVARLLTGIPGLIVPRVVRFHVSKPDLAIRAIERAGLEFPLILRRAGTHAGKILGRLDSIEQVQASLDGVGAYFATQFVDFRSADGLYRKYRVFFIGRRIVFRHMLVSDRWNIHAHDRTRFMIHDPALLQEEKRLFEKPEGALPDTVTDVLQAVRERMPLDCFGMDFGIAPDGQVVLFEANATMNFFPFVSDPRFAYLKRCLEPAQQAFDEMIDAPPRSRTASVAELLTA